MPSIKQPLIPEITPQQAAEILGVSRKTIYRMIDRGNLRVRRLTCSTRRGFQYRIPYDDLIALRHDYQQANVDYSPISIQRVNRVGSDQLEMIRMEEG